VSEVRELYNDAVKCFNEGRYNSALALSYAAIERLALEGEIKSDDLGYARMVFASFQSGSEIDPSNIEELLNILKNFFSDKRQETVIEAQPIFVLSLFILFGLIASFFVKINILWIDAVRIPSIAIVSLALFLSFRKIKEEKEKKKSELEKMRAD